MEPLSSLVDKMCDQSADNKHGDTLADFLESKGYSVVERIGGVFKYAGESHTYKCENDGMYYIVKLVVDDDAGKKRKGYIENERIALDALWKEFPTGEMKSFLLPPGTEENFDEGYKGVRIVGFARFYVEGEVLGSLIRANDQSLRDWIDRFVGITQDLDNLPDLGLPRTQEKRKVDFQEIMVKNALYWKDEMLKLLNSREDIEFEDSSRDQMIECYESQARDIVEFLGGNKVVLGTALCELNPDHIVIGSEPKPYVLSYSRLNQAYPRYFDVAHLYAWMCAVTGELDQSLKFWENATVPLAKKEFEGLRRVANLQLMGALFDAVENEGGKVRVGCEAFL